MEHRIRAAGILLSGSKILMLNVRDFSGEYWILPGGGFETGDRSTKQSLEREFEEETGLSLPQILFLGFVWCSDHLFQTLLQGGSSTPLKNHEHSTSKFCFLTTKYPLREFGVP